MLYVSSALCTQGRRLTTFGLYLCVVSDYAVGYTPICEPGIGVKTKVVVSGALKLGYSRHRNQIQRTTIHAQAGRKSIHASYGIGAIVTAPRSIAKSRARFARPRLGKITRGL